jgi:hypothetical protein
MNCIQKDQPRGDALHVIHAEIMKEINNIENSISKNYCKYKL